MTNEIKVKGVTYPSQVAAAKALGLSEATVSRRIEGGKVNLKNIGKQQKQRVEIKGTIYRLLREASRQTGIHINTIKSRIQKGIYHVRNSANTQ
jgi:predicted transcriptional regulator